MFNRSRILAQVAFAAAGLLAITSLGTAAAGAEAPEAAAPSALRYYQAAVNIAAQDEGEFAGAVSFVSVVGGVTSVDVFLSRSSEVVCDDGSASTASQTLTTESREATTPGPVDLDIRQPLRAAHGEAVVDLVLAEDPGCGAPPMTTTLPAQRVTIDVSGTTPRFFTGVSGTVSSGSDRSLLRSYDFSRDGTGAATVGSLVEVSDAPAFLKYAVDRQRSHGEPPAAPDPAAPPGGVGAQAFYAGDGEDAFVQAFTTAPPERATTIVVDATRTTPATCPDGSEAVVFEQFFGAAPATLETGGRLQSATASGDVTATHATFDGCRPDDPPVVEAVTLPASLSLTATGPLVRVRDSRWQVTPGEGAERTHGWYEGRQAAGTLSVDGIGGTASGSITRAGR